MSKLEAIGKLSGSLSSEGTLRGTFSSEGASLNGEVSSQIGHVAYPDIGEKPSLNGQTIIGDKTLADYGFTAITPQEIDQILFGGE